MSSRVWLASLVLICLGSGGMAFAEGQVSSADFIQSYVITDITEPVTIDGDLSESFWESLPVINNLRQQVPYKNQPAILPTEIRLAKDQQNLYIAISCFGDSNKLVKTVNQRDGILNYDDCIDIFLDTFHDHRNAYDLMVNPLNTQYDGIIAQDGAYADSSWDGVWQSAVAIYPDRYVVEMAIPFRILRYGGNDTWGLQIMRTTQQTNEIDFWSGDGEFLNQVSNIGDLTGMTNLPHSLPLDVIPYGMLKVSKDSDPQLGSEKFSKHELNGTAGLDAELRLGTWMTMNGTLNPDYAQIESDPEQVNLSPEEVWYNEKRPFFQEMLENFNTPINLVYTRRLTDILAGGKMVTSVGDRSRLAVMDMQLTASDPLFPKSNFLASRYEQDMWEKGIVGVAFINREGTGGDESYNRVGSIDGRYYLNGDLTLMGQLSRSKTSPTPFSPLPGDGEWAGIFGGYYTAHNLYTSVYYCHMQTYFNSDLGFLQEGGKDKHGFGGEFSYTKPINRGILRTFYAEGDWDIGNSLQGEKRSRYGGLNTGFSFTKRFKLGLYLEGGYYGDYKQITGEEYSNRLVGINFKTSNLSWGNIEMYVDKGDKYYGYNLWQGDLQTTFYPFSKFTICTSLNWVKPREEDTIWTGRLKMEQGITEDLLWRIIVDGNSDSQYRFSGLLGYTYLPGSTIYFAYNERRDNSAGDFKFVDRLAQIKISYLLSM
jgi:hypothetical protein